ncbi:isochorismatase [Aquitalea magnusonii]|uniref:Isochorismatase n=1 Tax=Aquitalea magnusonii TaxID=332411 RepID=A0A3G9GI60_9NEIS|nr:cysteine hydrolase family protein [Aquitalea magnusonii]BBF86533.1 isochorismatase [Aquitalea magnusonii]
MAAQDSALIVIDLQNDYFPGGKYPLWNTATVLDNCVAAIEQANTLGIPVILVQHVADSSEGLSPFFNAGSEGVAIHPRILAAAPQATVVIKQAADSFYQTTLQATLDKLGSRQLLLCGMMTHNCVTHTALSPAAAPYEVKVLADCCSTVDQMMHAIALNALSIRVPLPSAAEALA